MEIEKKEIEIEKKKREERKQKAIELVSKMTLEEKAGLCSGKDCWTTKPVERLGLSSIMVSDGPHGLRKQTGATDNLGIGDSVPAVCFPTASAMACSFNRDLISRVGQAIGEECKKEDVSVVLGPGANMKRSPLCGRNFEYFSEDPIVSGELAAAMIHGVQSTGTGTSLKHFAVNNQEKRRMTISAVIDERTFRETYLKAFEIAVKKGNPDTVMCSYNKINGTYSSENPYLLQDILRKEWGYDGLVVSDWGAVHDRPLGVAAGLDLEMPGNSGYNDTKIINAVKEKRIKEEDVDLAAAHVTELVLKGMETRKATGDCDLEAHHKLAVAVEEEAAVLLKNDGNLLPGNLKQKAAVIGAFAKQPRFQGAGSSKINPIRVEKPWDCFLEEGMKVEYAKGYSIRMRNPSKPISQKDAEEQKQWIEEACQTAKGKDIVYLFAGLPEGYESEGFDRSNMRLPEEQNLLIEKVCACNENVVVILIGGAPVELPWLDKVKSVLLAYLGGEGMGRAIMNLLLGRTNPSGKLAETWPLSLKDTPAYHYFQGGRMTVEYRESIFVGYRYYDTAKVKVRFPFGHGLSYTQFTYSDAQVEEKACNFGDKLILHFTVTNTGKCAGKETALIFVGHRNETVYLPDKQLIEFAKVNLEAGESRQISIELDTKNFGYYNTQIKDWYGESGSYEIMVGSNVSSCPLHVLVEMRSPDQMQPDLRNSAPSYYHLASHLEDGLVIPDSEFQALYGSSLPEMDKRAQRPYTENNTLDDVKHTWVGKIIIKYANSVAKQVSQSEEEQEGMMAATIREMPFFAMVASGEGLISETMMHGILDLLNGHYVKGVKKLLK